VLIVPNIEMRRKLRPYFVTVNEKGVEHNKSLKWLYDVLSVIATTWSLSYIFSSFVVSEKLALFDGSIFGKDSF